MGKLEKILERLARHKIPPAALVLSETYRRGVFQGRMRASSGASLEECLDEKSSNAYNAGIIGGWLDVLWSKLTKQGDADNEGEEEKVNSD